MNLFATSQCPRESALSLDDKRVGKLLMEANQMMSVAVKIHYAEDSRLLQIGPRQLTIGMGYINHPVSKWVRSTSGNFHWCLSHAMALGLEYSHRFGKNHESFYRTRHIALKYSDVVPQGPLEPFQNSARNLGLGLDFTSIPDTPLAYQLYLNARWETDKRPPTWTRRDPPSWIMNIVACSGAGAVQV